MFTDIVYICSIDFHEYINKNWARKQWYGGIASIWAEESMQNKLGKAHQNCDVFERIVHEMSDVGYESHESNEGPKQRI